MTYQNRYGIFKSPNGSLDDQIDNLVTKEFFMKEPELFTKEEVISHLTTVISDAEKFGLRETSPQKLLLLEELLERVESRELPELNPNGDWAYEVQATFRGIYLNLIYRESMAFKLPNGKRDAPGFQMIPIKTEMIALDQFAAIRNKTVSAVRKEILQGKHPYAELRGARWFLPITSVPLKLDELIGEFHVMKPTPPFLCSDGSSIHLDVYDYVKITELQRDNMNQKHFAVHLKNFNLITRVESNPRLFNLRTTDKTNFLFYLIRSSTIQYWSANVGLKTWLLS